MPFIVHCVKRLQTDATQREQEVKHGDPTSNTKADKQRDGN